MRTFGLGLQLGVGNSVLRRVNSPPGGNFLTLITGEIGSSTGKTMLSSDSGLTWDSASATSTLNTANIDAVITAGDRLYIRHTGGTNRVYTSTDGVSWTVCTGVETGNLSGACKVGSTYVLSFTNSLRLSTDGVNFTQESTQIGSNYGCAAIGDVCVVSATINNYKLSTDGGSTWSNPASGISAAFAASSATTFALCAGATVRRSATGLSGSWSSSTVTGMGTCDGIASDGDSTFVVIDTTGKIFYSIDNAATWTSSTDIGISGFTTGVVGGNGAITYAGGFWLASLYNNTTGVAKIFRSASPSGPFTEVYSWVNNVSLGGIAVVPSP